MKNDVVIIGSSGANLASLAFALQRLDVEPVVTEDPGRIGAAKRVILPGVGAAADAMARLRAAGLDTLIPRLEQPLLGICLGMQLLFSGSAEENAECLDIIPGRVDRLAGSDTLPVPHMGWNQVEHATPCALLPARPQCDFAYFVHSYAVPVGEYTLATTDYGTRFSAVVQRGNFYGTQFHPERSSVFGSAVLRKFLEL